MKWGDVPTWVMAGTAIISLIALVRTLQFNSKILGFNDSLIESNKELLRIESNRDNQANKVSSWAIGVAIPGFPTPMSRNGSSVYFQPRVSSIVFNGSNQPIYDVVITWYKMLGHTNSPDKEAIGTAQVDLVPPMGEWPETLRDDVLINLNPSWSAQTHVLGESKAQQEADAMANRVRVFVTFNDAAGQRWSRSVYGNLLKENPNISKNASEIEK